MDYVEENVGLVKFMKYKNQKSRQIQESDHMINEVKYNWKQGMERHKT